MSNEIKYIYGNPATVSEAVRSISRGYEIVVTTDMLMQAQKDLFPAIIRQINYATESERDVLGDVSIAIDACKRKMTLIIHHIDRIDIAPILDIHHKHPNLSIVLTSWRSDMPSLDDGRIVGTYLPPVTVGAYAKSLLTQMSTTDILVNYHISTDPKTAILDMSSYDVPGIREYSVERLLALEGNIDTYVRLLAAIDQYPNNLRAIAKYAQFRYTHISTYVSRLIPYGIAERVYPILPDNTTSYGMYRISDHKIRSWIRTVCPPSKINTMRMRNDMICDTYPFVCQDWLHSAHKNGQIPFHVSHVGSGKSSLPDIHKLYPVVGVDWHHHTAVIGAFLWDSPAYNPLTDMWNTDVVGKQHINAQISPINIDGVIPDDDHKWQVFVVLFGGGGKLSAVGDEHAAEINNYSIRGRNWVINGIKIIGADTVLRNLIDWDESAMGSAI